MNILLASLKALKLKLITGLVRRKSKKTELEQKCWKHVRNFAPTHYSWQKSIGRDKGKKGKKGKNRKFSKKPIIQRVSFNY